MSAKKCVIMGTGGFALEMGSLLLDASWSLAGFLGPKSDTELPAIWLGEDVHLGSLSSDTIYFAAIGKPVLRRKISQWANDSSYMAGTFIHPSALKSSLALVGAGCMIYPNATLQAGVCLDEGVLINSNASIGHETQIGSYSNIGPGASIGGRCRLGEEVYIGIGATIVEEVSITSGTVIGAGATVIRDIRESGTYVGTPARRLLK